MMGHREKLKSGDEVDALLKCKRFYDWRPGVRKRVKAWVSRRLRREPVEIDDAS